MSSQAARTCKSWLHAILVSLIVAFLGLPLLAAEKLRIATFNTEMSRKGPGLLLRDIERGNDAKILAAIAVIAQYQPDVLILQGIDWDYDNLALKALERRLALAGSPYPYLFSRRPNSGLATGIDLNGDNRLNGPADSQGYGSYTGQGGMAVLSRLPIRQAEFTDLSALLWRDVPGATLPRYQDGDAFPSRQAHDIQRLSSKAHWALPIILPDGGNLTILAFHAAPPLFDGPEDRNGLRNADEINLWRHFMSGSLSATFPPPQSPFVIAGDANLDPIRGEGRHSAIQQLLWDPRLQDPKPRSAHAGLNTVSWGKAGKMRVDYILPSREIQVIDAGVAWPETAQSPAAIASRHRLVWVDVEIP